VILAFLAFFWVESPLLCVSLYALSALLDVADGHAARALNQG